MRVSSKSNGGDFTPLEAVPVFRFRKKNIIKGNIISTAGPSNINDLELEKLESPVWPNSVTNGSAQVENEE